MTPISTYPAWAMPEYASSRLRLVWVMAIRLPTTMLVAATKARRACHSGARWGRPPAKTRTIIAKAAALVPTDMNAVTGIGAPWYTSGVHMWNGAAETLNAKPTPMSTTPRINNGLEADALASWVAMSGMIVVPEAP